jgi:hypothetical protein
MMDAKCPNCGSDQTQSVQMMMQAGTTRGTSTTSMSGVGIGFSGGIGIGVGSASSSTFSQSDLVRKFRLPGCPHRSAALPIIAALLGMASLMLWKYSLYGPALYLMAIGAILMVIFMAQGPSIKRQQEEWHKRRVYLSRAWLCHRCGQDWIPQ